MKILVTGGLGFIGHHLVRDLEQLQHDVVITDIKTTYGLITENHMQELLKQRKALIRTDRIYSIDISDTQGMDWLLKTHKPDVVVHLAGLPRQKIVNLNPPVASQVLIQGLLNLLEASVKYQVQKFVYVSSSMVYGNYENVDANENYNCHPQGQYAIMKMAGEWLVRDYSARTGLCHVILRPSAVYGPRDLLDRVVSKFFHCALHDQPLQVHGADQKLDFTFVEDTVKGIVAPALDSQIKNKTYNISRGQTRTLLQAAQLVTDISGKGIVELHQQDSRYPSRGSLDISMAKKDFGFDPNISIEQGFKIYYEWLKQQLVI